MDRIAFELGKEAREASRLHPHVGHHGTVNIANTVLQPGAHKV